MVQPTPPYTVPLPRSWVVEGDTLDGRTRIRVDSEAGTITELGEWSAAPPDLVLPVGVRLLPGFLDLHVHCRDDPSESETYKEDFETASRAALHGGVVLVGDMPNNPKPPIDRTSYEAKRLRARSRALVDVVLYGGVGPGTAPFGRDLPYKCYYGPSVGNLNFVGRGSPADPMGGYRGHWIAFHAEAQEILEAHRAAATHEARRPAEAEAVAIRQIAELAERFEIHAHIAHLSSEAGLEEIRRARKRGVPLSTEVTPHHLFFDQVNRVEFEHGAWLQMNPPLRQPSDRQALFAAFASGEIEILATDHAPHSLAENQRGISGVPHLDTYGGFVTWLAAEGVPWKALVERCSTAPARLFAPFIDGQLGSLEVGNVASFVALDTRRPWLVRAADVQSRAGWSPFEGVELPGRVTHTCVRGRLYEVAPRSS
ncbi:MAG: amidohydrolase family protein [Planctomycetota bacterium]